MAKEKQGKEYRPSLTQWVAVWFKKPVDWWGAAFGRTSTAIAGRFRYSFFLILTIVSLTFLFWDYQGFWVWSGVHTGGSRALSSVENSLFDTVISKRPVDPASTGRVVIAQIDECSIDYFEKKGMTGWPWPRDRHADLLTALGDAGVAVVGYDVMFLDKQSTQAESDDMLLQVAKLGVPTYFGGNLNEVATGGTPGTTADRWPTALPLAARPGPAPGIDMQLPYGKAMRARTGFVNIGRAGDGVVRDFDVWKKKGDWAVPSMAALVAAQYAHRKFTSFPASIRVNWRTKPVNRLPKVSAVDLLPDEHTPCLASEPGKRLPDSKGKIVLVGYVASGINDFKPTPIDREMPGVELQGEAVENLIGDTWIRMPDDGFKYALAAILILLIGVSFWRGESARDIDAIFTVTNLVLTLAAVLALTFSTYFVDVFTSIGISLTFFGLCRTYLLGMKGRALGSDDHVPELGHKGRLHVVLLLLRISIGRDVETAGSNPDARRYWEKSEYRLRIRRVLYAHGYAKIHEGLIERKTFLASDFRDVILMVCDAPSVEELRWEILHDLKLINEELARIADETRLDQVATASAAYVDLSDLDQAARAISLQNTLGKVLQLPPNTTLRAFIAADVDCLPRYVYPKQNATSEPSPSEVPPCATPSES